MDKDMKLALDKYIERIKEDYKGWTGRDKNDQVNNEMTEKFCNSISIKEGQKYYKVLTDNSVHSFIVKKDSNLRGKDFKRGDMLKSASWASPALNCARGNILGAYDVQWTGALYMTGPGRFYG
jgi:hypothetical protein